jgi:hypothetical protein
MHSLLKGEGGAKKYEIYKIFQGDLQAATIIFYHCLH